MSGSSTCAVLELSPFHVHSLFLDRLAERGTLKGRVELGSRERSFLGVADVFGTKGAGSTVIGISGIFTWGRTLGVALGAGVSVAAGNGGSCAQRQPC